MTDSEIIKGLECCSVHPMKCRKCPYKEKECCTNAHRKDALDLINRLKAENENLVKKYEMAVAEREANVKGFSAEIERLTELFEGWKKAAYKAADEKDEIYRNAIDNVKTARAEAYKEFAERILKDLSEYKEYDKFYVRTIRSEIYAILKEMG